MDAEEIGGVEVPESVKQKRMPEFEPVRQRRRRWPFFVLFGCLLLCCICLIAPICLIVTGVATAASVLENSKVTDTGVETVAVDPGEVITLEIDNRVGEITVQRGSSDEVVVNYTKTAKSFTKSMARDVLNDMSLVVDKPGADRVTITVDQEKDEFFCGNDDNGDFFCGSQKVDMTISVPDEVKLVISNNVGDVRIDNVLAADLQVTTNTGDVRFDGELGESGSFSIETNVGDIVLVLPDDAFLDFDASADVGDINLSDFDVSGRDTEDIGLDSSWQGTLGNGDGTPPSLRLVTNVGDISIQQQ